MIYLTKEEIVDNIVSKIVMLYPLDADRILSVPRDNIRTYNNTMGRSIRNDFLLWDDNHPETKEWHDACKNNTNQYIKNGIDCHPNHPDAVSVDILFRIWDKLKEIKNELR